MEQDKHKDKDSEKGFSGFESLLSDLDSSAMQDSARADAPDDSISEQPAPPHGDHQSERRPQSNHGTGSGGISEPTKQILAIAFVGVLGLVAVWSHVGGETSAGGPYAPAAPRAIVPVFPPPTNETGREAPPVAFPLEVRQPPIGTNHILSSSQLRYCIAEEIRIDGADAAVSSYDAEQVDRFNAVVDDYNSRCGEFRYRQGSLQAARESVSRYRSQLEAEGRARFITSSASNLQAEGPSSGRMSADEVRKLLAQRHNADPRERGTVTSAAGTWVGTYNCNQGLTAVRVTLRDDGAGRVQGLFAFSAHWTNPYVESGSYLIRGEVTAAGHIAVNGTGWVDQPAGYEMVGFSGQITGSSITGEIPFGGCTWIRLDRS